MQIGDVYRYARPYSAEPPKIDGLPNYFYATACPRSKFALLERGINPIREIQAVDAPRRPAILVSSSPHKVGTGTTPWQDFFDVDNGHIRYYGDNKAPGQAPDLAPGNRLLRDAFAVHNSPDLADRESAVPLVFFRRVPHGRKVKGYVQFMGFGIVERAALVTQLDGEGRPFANYVFDFVVLSLSASSEVFDWGWISARRDSSKSTADTLTLAPTSWKAWIAGGGSVLERHRRRVARLMVTKAHAQRPAEGSPEEKILAQIYSYYTERKVRFEGLAALVAERVLSETGSRYISGWVTPPSSDGGADFVGRLDVGSGFASTKLVVLGQAKCERPDRSTGGRHIARTVARLQRGWIGVYVTTGSFSEAVQMEVIEDQYPLILVHGLRLAREIESLLYEKGYASVRALLDEIDSEYDGKVAARRPEEILME